MRACLLLAREGFVHFDWLRAEWSQACDRIGQRDHRVWTGVLFTVEGRWFGGVEATGHGIVRVIEPEAHVKRVGRLESDGRIKAEDLVEQDGLDGDLGLAAAVGLNIRLVP